MTANAVPGFLPSANGFRFANTFPRGPTVRIAGFDPRWLGIGDASAGLCGGMTLTVRDLFEAGLATPSDAAAPANGSSRFQALVRRQVESLDWMRVPLRFLDLQALRPDPPRGLARLLHREPARVGAVSVEGPRIRAEIDAGHPAVVGLVRSTGLSPWALTRNHQVLAYGYDATADTIRIRVYDPNYPGHDGVELRADIDPDATRAWRDRIQLSQSTGEPLLGFVRLPYPAPRTLRAWR